MITRIFDKSKPINFLIIFFVVLLVFIDQKIKTLNSTISFNVIVSEIVTFLVCLANLAVLNFIVSKNNLTKNSSYKILLFSLFLAMMPFALNNSNMLLSNLFVLLALRRIISLKSLIKVKKKLLDASVLITIASLFYFWSILFLILVFLGLVFYSENKVKNWIIPFVGILAVIVMVITFDIIKSGSLGNIYNYFETPSFNFNNYNRPKFIIGVTVILSFGLWASFFYINSINKKLKSFRPSYIMILFTAMIAIVVAAFAPEKNGSELLFLFAPLSIIITNYIEVINENWFKEVFMLSLVLIPVSFQFF